VSRFPKTDLRKRHHRADPCLLWVLFDSPREFSGQGRTSVFVAQVAARGLCGPRPEAFLSISSPDRSAVGPVILRPLRRAQFARRAFPASGRRIPPFPPMSLAQTRFTYAVIPRAVRSLLVWCHHGRRSARDLQFPLSHSAGVCPGCAAET
jgi:hypothetical protein